MAFHNILTADCLKDFHCIGPQCELTCCNGWRIDIDDKTYKKYKNCKDELWHKCFLDNISKPVENKSLHIFKLDENGDCPFLNEENLCSIQKRFGANFLSKVCDNYPRFYNKINNQRFEKNYSMSCPEVIKKILLLENKISFSNMHEKIENWEKCIVDENIAKTNPYQQYFNELRKFMLDILQNREYKIKERLLILAYFFNNFNNEQGKTGKIDVKELIALFEQIVSTGAVREIFAGIKPDRAYYFSFLQDVMKNVFSYSNGDYFYTCCQKIYEETYLYKETRKEYFYLYDGYYSVFTNKNPHVLENYLVYCVFAFCLPLNTANLWDSFVEFILRWTIINFCFMGVMSQGTVAIGEEKFLRYFATFSRKLDSSNPPKPLTKLREYLEANKKNDIIHMFKLIQV